MGDVIAMHASCKPVAFIVTDLTCLPAIGVLPTSTQEAAASGMPAPVQVPGRGDVGWEEGVTAACCHTLQTTLARSAAESAVQPKPLTCPDSSAELKQLLGIVLERLAQHQP